MDPCLRQTGTRLQPPVLPDRPLCPTSHSSSSITGASQGLVVNMRPLPPRPTLPRPLPRPRPVPPLPLAATLGIRVVETTAKARGLMALRPLATRSCVGLADADDVEARSYASKGLGGHSFQVEDASRQIPSLHSLARYQVDRLAA
uniref:Uncharacterized protein n=1 Tax=Chromera velia CCMP2878 TaxID=1169474 RepID=A0A0K6SAC1_9ALVE|eukprot:Cvel_9435.t1-p1 / transcript=Cvel_9435.t1 / gene=Cvel_9435 / organism=Chromera_velia_CCMP2878 / gene_product=hypothetical protein / transcript_product=hypothetical protein / location=Cvel_scaffold544:29556-29990(-) / protein_length=145 / sequence_SO=supercontig / SO=protein_coding / is_pseudo=false